MEYVQSAKKSTADPFLYVYDLCKPNPGDPTGTYVLQWAIPANFVSEYVQNTNFDGGPEPTFEIAEEQYYDNNGKLDGLMHPLIITSSGEPVELKGPTGASLAEPVTLQPSQVLGWSLFETHYFPSPETCPSLPPFRIKDTYAFAENSEDQIVSSPLYQQGSTSSLNFPQYEFSGLRLSSQCTTNTGSSGYYYSIKYLNTPSDFLWSVTSSQS